MIIVKGMEMPERCFTCPLNYGDENLWMCMVTEHSLTREEEFAKRPTSCPLIEVPEDTNGAYFRREFPEAEVFDKHESMDAVVVKFPRRWWDERR